jgi:hypothetical protein
MNNVKVENQKPILKYDIAINEIKDFFTDRPLVFFGTGVSCALDNRFGMSALKDALLEKLAVTNLSDIQKEEWGKIETKLIEGQDLESALNAVTEEGLLNQIIQKTGEFVSSIDKEYSFKIAAGQNEWPAIKLMKKLVGSLSINKQYLPVITPNYDLLFEYACDKAGLPYTNGFIGGVRRKQNWKSAKKMLIEPQSRSRGRTLRTTYKYIKHIRMFKVHGSLNYFEHDKCLIENNTWIWDPPSFVKRVIITPGLAKYQETLENRVELLSYADSETNKDNRFLFLGYGFNDNHLDLYIKRKLIVDGCKGLIVTRDSNPRISSLMSEASNLWLICKGSNQNSTLIYNNHYAEGLEVDDLELWDFSQFTSLILGG